MDIKLPSKITSEVTLRYDIVIGDPTEEMLCDLGKLKVMPR